MGVIQFDNIAVNTFQVFPANLRSHTYPDPGDPDHLLGRTEVERRGEYIQLLHQQLGDEHPLVQLVKHCLHNTPSRRPSTRELLQRLENMRPQIVDPYEHLTKLEAMRILREKDAALREKDAALREKDMEMEDLRIQAQVSRSAYLISSHACPHTVPKHKQEHAVPLPPPPPPPPNSMSPNYERGRG